ncbi:hypothetical protein BKA70DRAFT_1573302 [Coprinopsis sp. MPI-PUGE-AT-0042]|nr:hypothetical protein BKA70DRAFT_1573302 [Coprinopsis sp. MPI-PUGE-AT-0042]
MPDIPVDILLKVIEDHIYDDYHTLFVTSLVCKDVVFTSQRCLFRRLGIRLAVTDGTSEPSATLQGILARPERLISCIKGFSLQIAFATTEQCLHWFATNRELFHRALDRLLRESSITNLRIEKGSGGDVFAIEWSQSIFRGWLNDTEDGNRMVEYIHKFCSLPLLKALELARLPTTFLHRPFPSSLRQITANRLQVLSPSDFAPSLDPLPSSPVPIERLFLSSADVYTFEEWMGPVDYLLSDMNKYMDVRYLKHLLWEVILSGDRNALVGILERSCSSLQSLVLKCNFIGYQSDDPDGSRSRLGLYKLPNLRQVTFIVQSVGERGLVSGAIVPLHWVYTLCDDRPSGGVGAFQALSILKILMVLVDWSQIGERDMGELRCLGQALGDTKRFPSLKKVEVIGAIWVGNQSGSRGLFPLGSDVGEGPKQERNIREAMDPIQDLLDVKWKGYNSSFWDNYDG